MAPAKLNLYLEVGEKRLDGFHEIDSIFQEISLCDELEFLSAPGADLRLDEEGIAEKENNLVLGAARKLRERAPSAGKLGATIRLKKRIPQGAGLGGGSSDAAATLLGLSALWGLGVTPSDLLPLAEELGSDVPFFLVGGTARLRGRGEQVESWADTFDLAEPFHYVLAYPRVKVNTKAAYGALDALRGPNFTLTAPSPLDSMPRELMEGELRSGRLFCNRFESVIYRLFPDLQKLHAMLTAEPFLKVVMSGSGSTIYGVCRSSREAEEASLRLGGRLDADIFAVRSEPRQDWTGLLSLRDGGRGLR